MNVSLPLLFVIRHGHVQQKARASYAFYGFGTLDNNSYTTLDVTDGPVALVEYFVLSQRSDQGM